MIPIITELCIDRFDLHFKMLIQCQFPLGCVSSVVGPIRPVSVWAYCEDKTAAAAAQSSCCSDPYSVHPPLFLLVLCDCLEGHAGHVYLNIVISFVSNVCQTNFSLDETLHLYKFLIFPVTLNVGTPSHCSLSDQRAGLQLLYRTVL